MQSDTFRAAAESKDFSAFEEIFAEDVAFRSPAVFRPYEGRDAVAMLLATVAVVFEDFRYTDQVETGATAMLAFTARVGSREPSTASTSFASTTRGRSARWPSTSAHSAASMRSPRQCSAR